MSLIFKGANFALAIVLGVAALGLLFVAIPAFGNKALIVRSGSMQPTIKVGDLVVVKSRNELLSPTQFSVPIYKAGDIIAFKGQKDPNVLTTHRIVDVKSQEGSISYVTRGDANSSVDKSLVSQKNVIGKGLVRVPHIGKLIAFTKSNTGFPLLVIFPALLVIIAELTNIYKEVKRQRQIIKISLPQAPNLAGLKVILPILMSLLVVHSTFAFFSDTETSINNSFTASPIFTNHIVISEVQIHGANANQDFVELYNPTNSSVDLSGWKLRKRIFNGNESSLVVISNGKSIQVHGFFLWANNQGGFDATIGADESNGNNITENNSVALLTPENVVIDQIAWGNGSNQFIEGGAFPNNPATSQSAERKALSTSTASSMGSGGSDEFKGNGFDLGNNATDFILRAVSQPQHSGSPTETL